MGDVPEQVFVDAAQAFGITANYSVAGTPEMAGHPPFRAAVASAYRAGQATAPDGPRAWALLDGAEVEEQWEVYDERDDEFAHVQTTEKFARAAARELDLALRRRQIIMTPWEPVDGQASP